MTTAPAAEQDQPQSAQAGAGAWWMLAVLCALYVFSFIDRYAFNILAPEIQRSLELSDVEMGLVLGPAFATFYFLFGFPLGWAADRWPRRWVIFLGCVVFGLATASAALAATFLALFIARACVGIGEASLSPAAYSLMGDKFPRRQLGRANSIYVTANDVGTAAAYGLGGLALGAAATLPIAGVTLEPWRLVLIAAGAPVIVLSLLVFTFSEPHRVRAESKKGLPLQDLFLFFHTQRRWLAPMFVGFALMAICAQALAAWSPIYLSRHFGWSPVEFGPIFGVIAVLSGVSQIIKGAVIDWLYARGVTDSPLRLYSWLLAAAVPVIAIMFMLNHPLAFILGYGALQIMVLSVIVFGAPALQNLVPSTLRGRIFALLISSLAIIGGSVGPPLVGILTDHAFRDPAMIGYSMACVVASTIPLAWLLLRAALGPLRSALTVANEADVREG